MLSIDDMDNCRPIDGDIDAIVYHGTSCAFGDKLLLQFVDNGRYSRIQELWASYGHGNDICRLSDIWAD